MIAWFIVPFVEKPGFPGRRARWLQLNEERGLLKDFASLELPGNRALVKVDTDESVLQQLAAKYQRLPVGDLKGSLGGLDRDQKTALAAELSLSLSPAEIAARLPGDLGQYTFEQVALALASKRFKVATDGAGRFFDSAVEVPVDAAKELADLDAKPLTETTLKLGGK